MSQTLTRGTSPLDTVREVVQSTAADRVFGAPIEHGDLTLLPVARISGGGGGGGGTGPGPESADEESVASGFGGGVGVAAKPLGVFVIKNGKVRWRPAVDVNKVIMGGQIVMIAALLTVRAIIKARSKG